MPMKISKIEAQLLANALNKAKLEPKEREELAAVSRKLAGFLTDGMPTGDTGYDPVASKARRAAKMSLSITKPTSTDPDMATLYKQVFGD